jgi:hypothetical protein
VLDRRTGATVIGWLWAVGVKLFLLVFPLVVLLLLLLLGVRGWVNISPLFLQALA